MLFVCVTAMDHTRLSSIDRRYLFWFRTRLSYFALSIGFSLVAVSIV